MRQVFLLLSIPVICGAILVLLFTVFTHLNLYFLEAQGLILDQQVRDAYHTQVTLELLSVIGYVLLQLGVTLVVSILVMRWASSPFANAKRMIHTALRDPGSLKPQSRWFSESPAFDQMIWKFCLRVKNGGESETRRPSRFSVTNYPFLLKFFVTFTALSVCTGYVMSIIVDTVYLRIVSLALQLVKTNRQVGHYFLAQQEILQSTVNFTILLSLFLYFLIGLGISRYMATMIFVFSRAIHDDNFPLTLRASDIYGDLAVVMNEARGQLR
jgi:hypothetical protein